MLRGERLTCTRKDGRLKKQGIKGQARQSRAYVKSTMPNTSTPYDGRSVPIRFYSRVARCPNTMSECLTATALTGHIRSSNYSPRRVVYGTLARRAGNEASSRPSYG